MIETIMTKENLKRAQLVRAERERRAWTQEHLASVSGITTRTIQRIEKDGKAGKESLMALSSVLEIDIEKLMEEEPQKMATEKLEVFPQISNGKEALDMTIGSDAFNFDYQYCTGEDAREVAAFLEYLKDAGEIGNDVGIGHQQDWIDDLDKMLKELLEKGFITFGKNKRVKVKTTQNSNELDFNVATIYVVKKDSAGVFQVGDKVFLRVLVPVTQKFSF